MTESMQMDLNLYLGFPWSCEHASFVDVTYDMYDQEDEETGEMKMQAALWCSYAHRILECECMGMECPYCKVRKAEDIAKIMAEFGKRVKT